LREKPFRFTQRPNPTTVVSPKRHSRYAGGARHFSFCRVEGDPMLDADDVFKKPTC
jgi:hypothetical protein